MSAIVKALNKFIVVIGNGVNAAKKAVDKVLWGNVDNVTAVPAPGTPPPEQPKKTKVGSFIQSGLFNVMDALLQVDLCNIINYLIATADNELGNVKRSENPTKIEKALYELQDAAILVRQAIDSFYAAPSEILKDLRNPDPQAAPAPGTTPTTDQPPTDSLAGSNMQKYNFGIVGKYAKEVFKGAGSAYQLIVGSTAAVNSTTQGALVDPEVQAALKLIPGFNAQMNGLKDYLNIIDQYADFRSIPNDEFQMLLKKLDDIRGVCVTIENFSLAGALDLVEQFVGTDVRSQIAQLNQFLNPTKLVPTFKQINDALRSFINTCRTIQTYIRIGRGVIKIVIVLVRVFRFIASLISSTPAPLMFLTYNVTARLEDAKEAAKSNSGALMEFLGQFNTLLGLLLNVVTYLQQNTQALLDRLDRLLAILSSCNAMSDSDIVKQLTDTRADLVKLSDELAQILATYENKSKPKLGEYEVVIVEEELVDEGIQNRRRRGVALGLNGVIAAQSDLTFATDNNIIIGEVKLKLVAAGLLSPDTIDTDPIIQEALRFLEDDAELEDYNIPVTPETAEIASDLNTVANSIKGAFPLRAKTKKILQNASSELKKQRKRR